MSSPRSLFAFWQYNNNQSPTQTPIRKPNGRFWSGRTMTGLPSDASPSIRSAMNSPLDSPADTLQSEEQTKASPRPSPACQDGLAPLHDYAEKAFQRYHQYSLSDSTATTASTDSSPTTTVSTVDDSSATDPSPGSSPESPPPATFAVGMLCPRTSEEEGAPFFELQKLPPPKKGRNLKGLAVNTSRHPRAASTTSLPLQKDNEDKLSIIASPGFVKPASSPKRKPSNLGLTLLTPGISKAPPQAIRLAIPPTPAFGRPGALRHFQSSPSLPVLPDLVSLSSPRTKTSHVHQTLETILSPIEMSKEIKFVEDEDQHFDIPLSQEEKPEAYPDGPICVYDPNIDLYLEPTLEQARQYDVILNVASEVQNPFATHTELALTEPEIRIDGGGGIQFAPKRPPREPYLPLETQTQQDGSPTTPKATPLNSVFPSEPYLTKDPEYIHVPWEHNSDIVPDLLRLVKLVDEKAQEGKRVLIHCQCGVSRSASLVVAYGLYKNPVMSVQEAYDAVKKRSKWIGPNMNLIMQLQEFRSSLMRGGLLSANRGVTPITPSSALSAWGGPFTSNSSEPISLHAPMSAGAPVPTRTPIEKPLSAVTPGPSSAPSALKWPLLELAPPLPTQRPRAVTTARSSSNYVDPSGNIVPVLKVVEPPVAEAESSQSTTFSIDGGKDEQDVPTPTSSVVSPRSEEFAMTPLQPLPEVASADSYGLMSPTSMNFAISPINRSALLASLGMGTMREHDKAPRRSASLRSRSISRSGDGRSQGLAPHPSRSLRGKISSPSLREQHQLQSLQAKIEAGLPHQCAHTSTLPDIDDVLLSPRATEFTKNPFALALSVPTSPVHEATPLGSDFDPRSPTQTGVSPITRNILDVL